MVYKIKVAFALVMIKTFYFPTLSAACETRISCPLGQWEKVTRSSAPERVKLQPQAIALIGARQ